MIKTKFLNQQQSNRCSKNLGKKNFKSTAITLIACSQLLLSLSSCKHEQQANMQTDSYYRRDNGIQTGGVKVIPIQTQKAKFNIWTKTIGYNAKIKVLLLAGGPGASHEYMECFESFFPNEGIEFIYYDQLGTGNSDVPQDTTLYDLGRSVEEVEQVRQALGLNKDNFYLFGHSWGGIVALEYALKYQKNLKSLIISDMVSSASDYNNYARNVLAKDIDPNALAEIRSIEARKDFANPRYMELLMPNYYAKHICRLPEWPEPLNRSFGKLNQVFYTRMQGPSEFGLSGKLTKWNRKNDLPKITVPTLTIGAKYDTMDPSHMRWMSTQVKNGSYLYCSNGSHMCFYDDQQNFFNGIIRYIKNIAEGQKNVQL